MRPPRRSSNCASEAADLKFATVCVNPTWVALAARQLRGTPVGVCSVVGFPLGATTPDVKQFETRRAIFDGASEIDMVINVGALKSGDVRLVTDDIRGVVSACHAAGAGSKVIIETALLTDEEKITACTLAKAAGRGLREDLDRLRPGRRHRRRCRADAPRRRRRDGREGVGRRARSGAGEGNGRRRSHAHRRQRRRSHRQGIARRSAATAKASGY